MKREAALSFFMEYLERYYFLICFTVYIHSERAALRSSSFGHSSFADWMKARPELYSIIRRYTFPIDSNPLLDCIIISVDILHGYILIW